MTVEISISDTKIYTSNRGNVTAGDRLLMAYQPTDTKIGFIGDSSSNVSILSEQLQTHFEILLPDTPIRQQTVSVSVKGYEFPNFDSGCGYLLGRGISGIINYVTGKVTLDFVQSLPADTEIVIKYDQDFEMHSTFSGTLGKQINFRFDHCNHASIKISLEKFNAMNSTVESFEVEALRYLKKLIKRELRDLK